LLKVALNIITLYIVFIYVILTLINTYTN
jgi:hypothetical protein